MRPPDWRNKPSPGFVTSLSFDVASVAKSARTAVGAPFHEDDVAVYSFNGVPHVGKIWYFLNIDDTAHVVIASWPWQETSKDKLSWICQVQDVPRIIKLELLQQTVVYALNSTTAGAVAFACVSIPRRFR